MLLLFFYSDINLLKLSAVKGFIWECGANFVLVLAIICIKLERVLTFGGSGFSNFRIIHAFI